MSQSSKPTHAAATALDAAKWCEHRGQLEAAKAKRQIYGVVILLLLGIVLLLLLPLFIDEVDYRFRPASRPSTILATATKTLDELHNTRAAIAKESGAKRKQKETLTAELEKLSNARHRARTQATAHFAKRSAVFQATTHVSNKDFPPTFRALLLSQDGRYFLAGSGPSGSGWEDHILLQSSRDTKAWSPIQITEDRTPLRGGLNSLLQANDGTFFAGGFEQDAAGTPNVLLLFSTDGNLWRPTRPSDGSRPILGRVQSVLQTAGGTFLACGSSLTANGLQQLLLLHSTDGQTWGRIHFDGTIREIQGELFALLQRKNETLVAVGTEYIDSDQPGPLVLQSANTTNWSLSKPKDGAFNIRGELRSIIETKTGTLIAAGVEEFGDDGERVLFLRSQDGEEWRPVRPTDDTQKFEGGVSWLAEDATGLLIATGWELHRRPNTSSETTSLLLHSDDGRSWELTRLYDSGGRLRYPLQRAVVTRDNILVLLGVSTTLTSLKKNQADRVREELVNDRKLPTGLVIDGYFHAWRERQQGRNAHFGTLERNVRQLDASIETSNEYVQRLTNGEKTLEGLTSTLERALRKAEPIREGGKIATRVAIIGLLIYLVQILFVRYRYHVRLSQVYEGTAQAIRLTVADSPRRTLFRESSLSELAFAVAAGSVNFGKGADMPPAVFASLFGDKKPL